MCISWGVQEFAGAEVWDRRCVRSLARIAEALAERHGLSFSAACGDALRQAAHRIFERETMTVAGMLRGHYRETALRAAQWCAPGEPVLVAQDTTELNYAGHLATEGLGYLSGSHPVRGLLAHSALALTPAGLPLGLLWLDVWARDLAQRGKKHLRLRRPTQEKESRKWLDALAGIEKVLPAGQQAVVIADREADFFDYFAAPRRRETHLLVRAHQPRRVAWELQECDAEEQPTVDEAACEAVVTKETIAEVAAALAAQPEVGQFTVAVPLRPGQAAREAVLSVRYAAVRLQVPRDYRRRRVEGAPEPEPVAVWVIEARETSPPEGAEPLHWVLLTTLPVDGLEDCVRIIGYYTRRWTIERLHYTLKSGLRVERLQMDDAHTLRHGIAMCFVVAWHLLWLTHLARIDPEAPATDVLTAEEVQILAAAAKRPIRTRRAVVRAIAQLGGFPGNPAAGEPGVKTLWLGFMQFTGLIQGWRLHQQASYDPR